MTHDMYGNDSCGAPPLRGGVRGRGFEGSTVTQGFALGYWSVARFAGGGRGRAFKRR